MSEEASRVWTVPNIISVVRLAGVPLFLWLVLGPEADALALVVLMVAGATDWLDGWLARFEPDVVAVERVFADANVSSVMTTAHATAVALLTATKRGIPVVFHTPTEVKAAVTGSGRAEKAQVTAMVTRILGLEVAPRPADAADALALAICHAWRGASTARLAALAAEARR